MFKRTELFIGWYIYMYFIRIDGIAIACAIMWIVNIRAFMVFYRCLKKAYFFNSIFLKFILYIFRIFVVFHKTNDVQCKFYKTAMHERSLTIVPCWIWWLRTKLLIKCWCSFKFLLILIYSHSPRVHSNAKLLHVYWK